MTEYRITDTKSEVPCGFDFATLSDAVDRWAQLTAYVSGLNDEDREAILADVTRLLDAGHTVEHAGYALRRRPLTGHQAFLVQADHDEWVFDSWDAAKRQLDYLDRVGDPGTWSDVQANHTYCHWCDRYGVAYCPTNEEQGAARELVSDHWTCGRCGDAIVCDECGVTLGEHLECPEAPHRAPGSPAGVEHGWQTCPSCQRRLWGPLSEQACERCRAQAARRPSDEECTNANHGAFIAAGVPCDCAVRPEVTP